MIRIGTAGWAYKDWGGIVYPKPLPRGFSALAYLSQFFDTLEINTSFYGPPKPGTTRMWSAQVAGNSRFCFTAKLWRGFTHEKNATANDEKLVQEGMGPLVEAGQFGALLIQFPISFQNTPENREYVTQVGQRFREFRWFWRCDTKVGLTNPLSICLSSSGLASAISINHFSGKH